VTIPSRGVFLTNPSSTKKVCATGPGFASPVVSNTIRSNFSRRSLRVAKNTDEVARATVQQMQPCIHLEDFFFGIDHEFLIDSNLAESFSMTAIRLTIAVQ